MTRARLLATLVMGCATAGCVVHTGFTKATSTAVPSRSPDCRLEVRFQGTPRDRYAVLGLVTTDGLAPGLFALGQSDVASVRRMSQEACEVGADGLMNVAVTTRFIWTGRGYWKHTTGEALAFIYVDASGRPLPPLADAPLLRQVGPSRSVVSPAIPRPAAAPGTPAPPR